MKVRLVEKQQLCAMLNVSAKRLGKHIFNDKLLARLDISREDYKKIKTFTPDQVMIIFTFLSIDDSEIERLR